MKRDKQILVTLRNAEKGIIVILWTISLNILDSQQCECVNHIMITMAAGSDHHCLIAARG